MHPGTQHWVAAAVGLFVASTVFAAPSPGAEIAKEYQLKAAFLYNFTRFIDWPSRRFAAAESPIVIGVYERNPFGDELERIVAGRRVNGRPLAVRLVTSAEEQLTTHLLFIPAGAEESVAARLPQLDAAAVVTVGESERFALLGGTICFVIQDDRLRFAIHDVSDAGSGLRISSQLLKLATTVHR